MANYFSAKELQKKKKLTTIADARWNYEFDPS